MHIYSLDELNTFIVKAKSATYVGDGIESPPLRPGSHDLKFQDEQFLYLDSYFGGSDFLGQEVVYLKESPIWAMNYYGRILDAKRITAATAGKIIKESLSQLYGEGRFLGGYKYTVDDYEYFDTNQGDFTSFMGKEWINLGNIKVYELVYHGGLIED